MKDFSLKPIGKDSFYRLYSLLEEDFCPSERKTREAELSALEDKDFSPSFILYQDREVGYICLWHFKGFVFVEHFAIFKSERGTGLGGAFLKELCAQTHRLIILEAERAHDTASQRRLEFYKRAGFKINGFDYVQPKYTPSCLDIPMHILSFDRFIEQEEYYEFTKQIKDRVYCQSLD